MLETHVSVTRFSIYMVQLCNLVPLSSVNYAWFCEIDLESTYQRQTRMLGLLLKEIVGRSLVSQTSSRWCEKTEPGKSTLTLSVINRRAELVSKKKYATEMKIAVCKVQRRERTV